MRPGGGPSVSNRDVTSGRDATFVQGNLVQVVVQPGGVWSGGDGMPAASRPRPVPPAPRLTVGRAEPVAELAANVLAEPAVPSLVLGSPGVGKTNLTLAVLHHEQVVARFAQRRFFVRCEAVTSAAGVVTELTATLGLPLGGGLGSVAARLAEAPAVVVLDNAETPWEADTLAVEDLLAALAAVPSVALVASLRGAERPGGPRWGPSVRLEPLGAIDARRLFLSIAGDAFDGPGLEALLAEMGGLALAVELLAYTAAGEADLAGLAGRWRSERVALLERGTADHRLLSVAVSLEASWTASLMTGDARRLLSLLGRLPEGIALAHIDAVLPGAAPAAANVLRKRGLAFDDANRLRTHPPVRFHLAGAHPPTSDDWERAVGHYAGLAVNQGRKVGGPDGDQACLVLAGEAANLEPALATALEAADPRPGIDAVVALGDFARFTGVQFPSIFADAVDSARHIGDTHRLAATLYATGSIALERSDHDTARAAYQQAQPLYRQVGNVLGEANCIQRLGDIALRRSDHDAARAAYQQAQPLYRQVGDVLGEANCIQGLGDIALGRSDHDAARAAYQQAQPLYRQVGHVLGEANCIQRLGDIALERSDHDARPRRLPTSPTPVPPGRRRAGRRQLHPGPGRHRPGDAPITTPPAPPTNKPNPCTARSATCWAKPTASRAWATSPWHAPITTPPAPLPTSPTAVPPGRQRAGRRQLHPGLGDIALERSDHDAGPRRYQQALPLYRQVGNVLGEANCIQGLGDIALERSDHDAARGAYQQAQPLYRQVGNVLGEANCIQGLGDIALRRSDHDAARAAYQQALALYERIPEPYSIGVCHRRLARLASSDDQRHTEVSAARKAWVSIKRDNLVAALEAEFGPSALPTAE